MERTHRWAHPIHRLCRSLGLDSDYSYCFQNSMVIEFSLFMPPRIVFSAQEGNAGIEIKRSMGLLALH